MEHFWQEVLSGCTKQEDAQCRTASREEHGFLSLWAYRDVTYLRRSLAADAKASTGVHQWNADEMLCTLPD